VPTGADVNVNSELFYKNGEYVNTGTEKVVEIIEKSLV
jgi:hypothetical protein